MISEGPVVPASEMDEQEFPQRRYKFVVLFFLYVSSVLPTSFFPLVFPVMLRQSGAPLEYVGLFGLLSLPVVLKFLWAPYVDAYGNRRFGHYKSWLVASQLVCTATGAIMAFLDFKDQFWWIMGLGFVFAASVSTQWIATNGLAVRCLKEAERPRGNSFATIGMTIGSICGGSMLILVSTIGYTVTLLLTFPLMIAATFMLLFFKEPPMPETRASVTILSSFAPLKSSALRRWLLLINLYVIGEMMISAMVRPMLVDKGLSLDSIGLMLGTVRPVSVAIGAAICPPILNFFGRKANLIVFGLINTFAVGLFILPALNVTGNSALYVICVLVGLSTSFKWTLIFSIFMDFTRKSNAATDFAIQVSVLAVGSSIYEIMSGVLASSIGYAPLFALSVALEVVGIVLVGLFFQPKITPAQTPISVPANAEAC